MEDDDKKDPISDALGITPTNTKDIVSEIIIDSQDDSALKDFESARANIYTMIDTAKEAIDSLAQIADSSQQPRAYEVLAKLIDTTVSANRSLLEMQEKIRQLKEIENPINSKAKTINNNLFVGSTAELQKLIKQIKNG